MVVAGAAAATAPTQVRHEREDLVLMLMLLLVSAVICCPMHVAGAAHARALPSSSSTAALAGPSTHSQSLRSHHTSGLNEGTTNSRRTDTVIPTPTQRYPPRPTGTTARGRGQGDIIFPDSQYKPRFSGNRPNCASGESTFCVDGVDGYPMVHLNQVLGNTIGYREYFGNDTLSENVADRFGMDGERTICQSEEKIIFPKMGQNADGQWVFIVNLDSNYQQGIRVELCKSADQPCLFANALPAGSNAVCRQKYIYRRLVAVGDAGEPQPDSFKMPSCCACYVNSEVTSRILLPNEPRTTRRRRRHMTRR